MTDAAGAPRADLAAHLTEVVRAEHGRIVGALVRRFGDVQLAEDAVGDALEVAWSQWAGHGVPANPGAWLTTTATRKALDRVRRESSRTDREKEATMLERAGEPLGAIDDDRLRLLFMCCHPALAPQTRIALTLRLVCGLSVAQIAAAFLLEERTLAQRLTRAKRKIRQTRIPFRVPEGDDLPERLNSVLTALYLVANQGYLSVGETSGVRPELVTEAIRITRRLVEQMPAEPEPQGLLALMLLTQAREPARVRDGRLVPLDEQDRRFWDPDLLDEGRRRVRALLAIGRPGPFQVQAAIAAAHTDEEVPWPDIVALYDLLLTFSPTPVVRLNRALATAHTDGPASALAIIDSLDLGGYHPWHVARAHLLDRLGRGQDAAAALRAALALEPTALERTHLERRSQQR